MRLYKRGQYWWCSFAWQGDTIRQSARCEAKDAAAIVAQRWERARADPDHAAAAAATVSSAVAGFLAGNWAVGQACGNEENLPRNAAHWCAFLARIRRSMMWTLAVSTPSSRSERKNR